MAVRRRCRTPPSGILDLPKVHPMRSTLFALRCGMLGGVCFVSALSAQQPAGRYDPSTYVHTSADIAMRDGAKVHVEIFSPPNATEPLPFLFERTPYGVGDSEGEIAS